MPLFSTADRAAAEAISRLTYCSPFLAERIELERRILGDAFQSFNAVWHPRADLPDHNPNVQQIASRAESLVETVRRRLAAGEQTSAGDRSLYRDLAVYVLYYRCQQPFFEQIEAEESEGGSARFDFYSEFRAGLDRLLLGTRVGLDASQSPEHLFACFFQVRRAFHYTFRSIAGSSMPAARLRAQVWQSIFTHDMRRFQRSLFRRLGDVTTLISGPSGTGKELVARAIGLSRYIPFDSRSRRFRESFKDSFYPLNLSALSPTLIESELFGHRRGSFTGAVADRKGWLQVCPPLGTVFLDEIGEIDAAIQVKLLRVLDTRCFQPLGTTEERRFEGKVVAATNRDLGREMREGRFRDDLYYRLCADTITAPSLAERIADSPAELESLIEFLAQRLVGEDEAPVLARQVDTWIERHLGHEYDWPGNVRELSQCVSNVLIRGSYSPAGASAGRSRREELAAEFIDGAIRVEELLRRYCTLVYLDCGNYVEAAKRLGLDRRTVKSHVDPRLAEDLRRG